jgi:hypothetical protein
MIKEISNDSKGQVTLLPGVKHGLEDGEYILINEVVGMELKKEADQSKLLVSPDKKQGGINSINGTIHKIEVINANSFYIGDTTLFEKYTRNGLVKVVKLSFSMK